MLNFSKHLKSWQTLFEDNLWGAIILVGGVFLAGWLLKDANILPSVLPDSMKRLGNQ